MGYLQRELTPNRRSVALIVAEDATGYLVWAYLATHEIAVPLRPQGEGGACRGVLDTDLSSATVASACEMHALVRWILEYRRETGGHDENEAAAHARADRLCRSIHQVVDLLGLRGVSVPCVRDLADELLALIPSPWPTIQAMGLPVRRWEGNFYVPHDALQRLIRDKPWGKRLKGLFTGQARLLKGMDASDVETALVACLKEQP